MTEEYLDGLSSDLESEYSALELYFIYTIASDVGKVLKSDKYSNMSEEQLATEVLKLADSFMKSFNAEAASVDKVMNSSINSIYSDIANKALDDYAYIAKHNAKELIELKDDTYLKQLTNSIARTTKSTYKNLSNTTTIGTYIRKSPNAAPTMMKSREAYINIMDKAIHQAVSGEVTPSNALRAALKDLSSNGLQYTYYDNENKKSYRRNVVSSARMNIHDGMRAVFQESSDYIGEQYGADGKEVSMHSNCAPDHLSIQGKQYTNIEYERMNSSLKRRIGTMNCRHFAFNIIVGVSEPTYSEEDVAEMNRKNEEGWTDTDNIINRRNEEPKKYTLYEASQELRKMENSYRKMKIQERVLREVGDSAEATKLYKKAAALRKRHTSLVEALEPYGIQPDNDRFISK